MARLVEGTRFLSCLIVTRDPGRTAALLSSRKATGVPSILKMLRMAAQLRRAKPTWMLRQSGSALAQPRQAQVVLRAPTTTSMSRITIESVRSHPATYLHSHLPCTLPASISHFAASLVARRAQAPVGVAGALQERARSFLPHPTGDFTPTRGNALLNTITDELLVVASDAVAAAVAATQPPPAGNSVFRLLAWVVADARGATGAMDKLLALTLVQLVPVPCPR